MRRAPHKSSAINYILIQSRPTLPKTKSGRKIKDLRKNTNSNERIGFLYTCQEVWSRNFQELHFKFFFEVFKNFYFHLSLYYTKTIYPRGKGPTQELYSSSRRTAVVPLFKNYMQFFFLVIFLGWVMLLHPQATSTDHGGPRTSDEICH